jgi:hypothetical protein
MEFVLNLEPQDISHMTEAEFHELMTQSIAQQEAASSCEEGTGR